MRLSYSKGSFLLTTDVGQAVEWGPNTQRAELRSSLLKVANHGTSASTSPEFLALVNPQLAVISVGKDNHSVITVLKSWRP